MPGHSPVVTSDWRVREQRLRPFFFFPNTRAPTNSRSQEYGGEDPRTHGLYEGAGCRFSVRLAAVRPAGRSGHCFVSNERASRQFMHYSCVKQLGDGEG